MEQTYWLGRKRASVKMARVATSSEARLVHYDLAGRYSLKALSADVADILTAPIMAKRRTGTLGCDYNG